MNTLTNEQGFTCQTSQYRKIYLNYTEGSTIYIHIEGEEKEEKEEEEEEEEEKDEEQEEKKRRRWKRRRRRRKRRNSLYYPQVNIGKYLGDFP